MEKPPLVIGIDARAAAEVSAGRGRVVRELLQALAARADPHKYMLYARRPWEEAALDQRFTWRLLGRRDPWWHLQAAHLANRECDVFLSSNSYLTTWFLRVPAVPIVHDMIPFQPELLPNRRSAAIERLTLGLAVRRSHTFLCVSDATAEALASRFPTARSCTIVASLGVTDAFDSPPRGQESNTLPSAGFVLSVGTIEPRKNLPRLIAAYAALDDELKSQHRLVVVGARGWQTGATLNALRALGDDCVLLGHVSDAALGELYRRCSVFCYPSLGEGFGLPVLEAMSCGAPVLTSRTPALSEVAASAAHYVDPIDIEDITRALDRILRSAEYRAELSARGRDRASDFSWARFAELTLGALTRAAGHD